MSFHQCYICHQDTNEKRGFLSTGTYIKVCDSCDRKVQETINLFPDHETRFTKKTLGIRYYSESYIYRNMLEVVRNIQPDEKVVDYVLGIFNSVKDTFSTGYYKGLLVLTNKRVMYFIPKPKIGLGVKIGVMGNTYEYVGTLNDVVEIAIETLKMDGSHILLRDKGGLLGSNNEVITNDDVINIERFVKNFQQLKAQSNSGQAAISSPTVDSMDQLKKLKSLLDDGILTTDEYEKKKTEILSRI